MVGNSRRPSGTSEMPAATITSTGRPVSRSPRNRTLPDVGDFSPVMHFMMVVFAQSGLRIGLRTGDFVRKFGRAGFFATGGAGLGERFTGKQLYRMRFRLVLDGSSETRLGSGSSGGWRFVRVVVIVIFEIFENVADVQESVAIETDVDESRLHSGQDAGDFAFVDAADEGELFFALDINFY